MWISSERGSARRTSSIARFASRMSRVKDEAMAWSRTPNETAPRVRDVVRPVIELLAGIPSVVFGFFGLVVLVEWLRVSFAVSSGESVLAGSLLLGIMTLPTIISVSEDAIASVPREFREASLALGATRWQTIRQVVVPSALSGITAAIILGMGRAIGETMVVLMVTGNAAVIPSPITDVLSPVRTLTGTLGIVGEVAIGSLHYPALFAVTVLLGITLAVNLGPSAFFQRLNASATGGASPSPRCCAAPALTGSPTGPDQGGRARHVYYRDDRKWPPPSKNGALMLTHFLFPTSPDGRTERPGGSGGDR